jgi:hypothetical protein
MIFVLTIIFINTFFQDYTISEIVMNASKGVAVSTVFYLFIAIVLFRDAFKTDKERTE